MSEDVVMQRDEVPAILSVEVDEVTDALAGVLESAGIRLPQLTGRPLNSDWAVRLGDCNVRVALALINLCRDGLTLRERHPEESANARS
ncbi:hypothetical protein ACG2OD_14705 [Streptomyces sp. PDY-4]|uniref:hypothetical protein n=1 Tax=Streptomyces sp. PDY-4 TaxID=3376070 RepID=UPI00378CB2CB